jgi:hypothetical protein
VHTYDDDDEEEEDCVINIEGKCFDWILNRAFYLITLGSSKHISQEIDDC